MLLLVLLGLIFPGIIVVLILWVTFSENAENQTSQWKFRNVESLIKVTDTKDRKEETASKSQGITEARN